MNRRDYLRTVGGIGAAGALTLEEQVVQLFTHTVETSADADERRRSGVRITSEAELADYLVDTFGVVIPKTRCCPDHCAPWDAFCNAYFARSAVCVWEASRGFGGKSFMLATLALTEALTLGADVNVLGGSGEQAQRVLEAMSKLWKAPNAPIEQLASAPAQRHTRFVDGQTIKALMASSTSVRGPHPQRLRLDEVDEMAVRLLDDAMGQPMDRDNIDAQTVMSSTHHYPDGTMTEVKKRAKDSGWPLFVWCWKETVEPHGWLTTKQIAKKRTEVTATMWETEYDLQEPSPEGRAIVTEAVDLMFSKARGDVAGATGEYYEFEAPIAGAAYATGTDWAKKQDFTVIVTLRIDVMPFAVVAYEQRQREPWPKMIARFDDRLRRYPGSGCHDGTGVGNVVHDSLTEAAEPFIMVGRPRQDLLTEYIKSVESNLIVAPYIATMQYEHKHATNDDVYGTGHLPDTIAAMALALRAAGGGAGAGFLEYARQQVAAARAAAEAVARGETPEPKPNDDEDNPWIKAMRPA